RNRLLNELASDWLCMFPLLSVTHNYRLQHSAHHKFVNDPQRDPDMTLLQAGGHRFRHPMPRRQFLWECVVKRLVWVPGLLHYTLIRSRSSTLSAGSGPYRAKREPARFLALPGALHLFSLVVLANLLAALRQPLLLAVVPACLWAVVMTLYGLAPANWYPEPAVKPVVSPRWWTLCRLTYSTVLLTGLSWMTYLTGKPWGLYYVVLWIVPLLWVFPFLMILREEVQHGGAGRGRLRHAR